MSAIIIRDKSRAKSKRRASKNINMKFQQVNLSLVRSYPGQPVLSVKVPYPSQLLTTTVTTGAVAVVVSTDPVSQVTAWSTRFQSLWQEYRVVKMECKINMFSSTNPGLLLPFWGEKDSSTPTATQAMERSNRRINFSSNDDEGHVFTWKPTDIGDTTYMAVGTSYNAAYFKLYSDVTLGSPIVVTNVGILTLTATIQFRGYI